MIGITGAAGFELIKCKIKQTKAKRISNDRAPVFTEGVSLVRFKCDGLVTPP